MKLGGTVSLLGAIGYRECVQIFPDRRCGALACLQIRYARDDRRGRNQAQSFIRYEEKCLVLNNGCPQRSARPILPEFTPPVPATIGEPIICLEPLVSEIVVQRAVKIIAAAAACHTDLGARRTSKFRRERRGLNPHFLHGIERDLRRDVSSSAGSSSPRRRASAGSARRASARTASAGGHIEADAVQSVVVRVGPQSVGIEPAAGAPSSGRTRDSRRHQYERVRVPAIHRQVLDIVLIHRDASRRVRADAFRGIGDRNGALHRFQLELDDQALLVPNTERDAADERAIETRFAHLK